MSAPIDLDTLKDDLGIPDGDTSQDEWLQRRIDGVWARFEQYTQRKLGTVGNWRDDWGKVALNQPNPNLPPPITPTPRASVFLRVFPVVSISKVLVNGSEIAAGTLGVELASGKLVGLDGYSADLGAYLYSSRAVIEYAAGFAEVPADLYEALLGVIQQQWATRQAISSGVGLGGILPRRVATQDVGEVELGSAAGGAFVESAQRVGGPTAADPLLGPYVTMLDTYVDWRVMLGGAPLQPTEALPDTAKAKPVQPPPD